MQINEVIKQIDLSKRAIKYYEEAGLLEVAKGDNGYRDYTEQDIKRLKEIACYRKLGISIKDIKQLLEGQNRELLEAIYKEKCNQLQVSKQEVDALEQFIRVPDVEYLYSELDYETIGQAMEEMLPGFFGYYWTHHFMPYLQIKIETSEQEEAYHNIIAFWDNVAIKVPLIMKLASYIMYKAPRTSVEAQTAKMEAPLKQYTEASDELYEKLKVQTKRGVKMQNSLFFKIGRASCRERV